MWKATLAGAFALATIGSSLASAETFGPDSSAHVTLASAQGGQVESGIARFRAALNLTGTQQRHWPAVESAIRDLVRSKMAENGQGDGFVRRMGQRVGEIASSASALRRLIAAAQPLIRTLDPDQKRQAMATARGMGFAQVAAYFE